MVGERARLPRQECGGNLGLLKLKEVVGLQAPDLCLEHVMGPHRVTTD